MLQAYTIIIRLNVVYNASYILKSKWHNIYFNIWLLIAQLCFRIFRCEYLCKTCISLRLTNLKAPIICNGLLQAKRKTLVNVCEKIKRYFCLWDVEMCILALLWYKREGKKRSTAVLSWKVLMKGQSFCVLWR